MNEKKSPFGDLCHQYRGKLHLSEQTMGQKIEKMGYPLGTERESNKQPIISQFERKIDPENANRKQHRDPPLAYVETCAELFGLSGSQKYSLFVAALQSSKKIVIDAKAIEGCNKDDILNIIASLVLFCVNQGAHFSVGPKKLLDAWNDLTEASKRFVDEIQQSPLEHMPRTFASVEKPESV